jgi:hypothetical protein
MATKHKTSDNRNHTRKRVLITIDASALLSELAISIVTPDCFFHIEQQFFSVVEPLAMTWNKTLKVIKHGFLSFARSCFR